MRNELIQSVERALDILECFEGDRPSVGISEFALRTGLSKATAHRLTATLVARGLLERDRATRRYRLGPRVIALGGLAQRHSELVNLALPQMMTLRETSGETVLLSLRADERQHFTVSQVESLQPIRMRATVGQLRPLQLGCSGKAILAFRPPAEQHRLLGARRQFQCASGTKKTSTDLLKDLARVSARGYAESVEELTPGAAGISVPILGEDGLALASLYIAGPTSRFTATRRAQCVPSLIDAGRAISERLGSRMPEGRLLPVNRPQSRRGARRGA